MTELNKFFSDKTMACIEYMSSKKGWTHNEFLGNAIGLMEYFIKQEDGWICKKKGWDYKRLIEESLSIMLTFILEEDDYDLYLVSKDKKTEKEIITK